MTKNPLLNSGAAVLYITLVAFVMTNVEKHVQPKDTIVAPIAFLSLFTLSAAFMAFTFFYQPVMLFFENQKKQAFTLIAQTIGCFAVITTLLLAILFFVRP
jgi:hypothetical protein